MALDPYQSCPCGSGKKTKFCCSKDIINELDKILRMIEGEQRAAALDQVNKLIDAKGERAALLTLKANLQIAVGSIEDASTTIAALFKTVPHNPVALALTAVVEASKGNAELAVERLQESLEFSDQSITPSVYTAIGFVAQALLISGEVLAARGHLIMQAGLAGEGDRRPIATLLELNASRDVPIILKEDFVFEGCPPDVRWRGEFEAAMKSAVMGAWLAASESLASLSEKVPGQPAIERNIAILRGWLGQTPRAAAAWRRYAQLDGLPLDDAVEAEALAQVLDDSSEETVEELTLVYALQDAERCLEQLLFDRRASAMPIDLQQVAEEGLPPPRGAFYLLDRPLPESGEALQLEDIPHVIGEMYVFGKETDREARLEFVLERSAQLEDHKAKLAELSGDLLGAILEEVVNGEVPALASALTWRWRMPDDTPRELRLELMHRQQREVLLQRWTQLPSPVLDGKTPREVAQDAAYHHRVLAAILFMELAADTSGHDFDFNDLRKELDLPGNGLRDPGDLDLTTVSTIRLSRIDTSQLGRDDLVTGFRRAALKNFRPAIYRFAKALTTCELADEQLDKGDVFEALIMSCQDTDEALEHAEAARKMDAERGRSAARWLMAELSIRLMRQEVDECNRVLQTLRTNHLREPGVAQALRQLLVTHGVITPEGEPITQRNAAAADLPPASPAEESQKIWTPDSAQPASAESGKSKLWVPGRD